VIATMRQSIILFLKSGHCFKRALKDYHIIWFSLSPLTIVSINIQCLIGKIERP